MVWKLTISDYVLLLTVKETSMEKQQNLERHSPTSGER